MIVRSDVKLTGWFPITTLLNFYDCLELENSYYDLILLSSKVGKRHSASNLWVSEAEKHPLLLFGARKSTKSVVTL